MIRLLGRLYKRLSRDTIKQRLVAMDETRGYKPPRNHAHELLVDELPLFTVWTARLMVRDPQVRFGLNVRNAGLFPAQVKVSAKEPAVTKYVGKLWQQLWSKHSHHMLKAKQWGYQGVQILYRSARETGQLQIEGVKAFSPHDTRALHHYGKALGFSVRTRQPSPERAAFSKRPLYAPKALWLTYDAEFGGLYGHSLLKRAYSPWFEKWMTHGYKKTLQLRMLKDSYVGDVVRYPWGRIETMPDGTQMSWRDIMREVEENRMAGGTIALPKLYDTEGRDLVDYSPPTDTGNPVGIFTWGETLDTEIWKGMDVFPEVVQASETGSGFSGRSIPLLMFLSALSTEFRELLQQVDEMVLRPCVWLEFGKDAEYEIEPVPLVEVFAEDLEGSDMGGPMGGNQPGGGEQPPMQQAPSQSPAQAPSQSPAGGNGNPFFKNRFGNGNGNGQAGNGQPETTSFAEAESEDNSADPVVDGILDAGGAASRRIISSAADRISLLLKKKTDLSDPELFSEIVGIIESARPEIQAVMEDSIMASQVAAAADALALSATSGVLVADAAATGPPTVPPRDPPVAIGDLTPGGREPVVRFPVVEDALMVLADSPAESGIDFRDTAARVHRGAFAITTELADETVSDIRDLLHENIAAGLDARAFGTDVQDLLTAGTGLSDARVNQVFRNNVGASFRDASERSLSQPIVAAGFPYRRYRATHDDRTRVEHRALETLGLDGTSIYRADDPVWEKFAPPWDWNCRCAFAPVTVEQAANAGVREAMDWWHRAGERATESGGRTASYVTDTAPPDPQYVEHPAFEPPPEWTRDLQFAEQLTFNFKDPEFERLHPRAKGGKFALKGTGAASSAKDDTEDEPPEEKEEEKPKEKPKLIEPYFNLSVPDSHRDEVTKAHARVPEAVRDRLHRAGERLHCVSKVTDADPSLKGKRPRGWPKGSKWEQVGGCYSPKNHKALTGVWTWERDVYTGVWGFEKRSALEVSQTYLHEMGHAVDQAYSGYGYDPTKPTIYSPLERDGYAPPPKGNAPGRLASMSPEFVKAYNKDRRAINARNKKADAKAEASTWKEKNLKRRYKYFLQPKDAGWSEAFAEGFASIVDDSPRFEDFKEDWPETRKVIEKIIAIENYESPAEKRQKKNLSD